MPMVPFRRSFKRKRTKKIRNHLIPFHARVCKFPHQVSDRLENLDAFYSTLILTPVLLFALHYHRQFKEDLWTIVAKFGERVFQMRDLEKDWAGCQDEFLEGIQHIVGKRGVILSFSDPNLNSSSSASMSSASLASSRRHSFIDYEMDIMRRDMEDMREESDNLRKELAAARQETEDVKAQLRQQIRSPPSSSREMRDGSESEPLTSYGRREVINAASALSSSIFFCFCCWSDLGQPLEIRVLNYIFYLFSGC